MNDTPAEREAESTWTRLRRRKVVQWGLVYVAAAWGFLQGLEYISESFNWPQGVRQIAVLVLIIGLPIVLVLAWYHGDRGQQRITTPEFAILTLLLLLGGGAFWYYQRASETAVVVPPPSTAAAIATDRSIAVLPFVNMSADKEQEYFADGISEELLNLLAQVPELRVIARTSSFSFKGKEVDIAEIARRLNVANVLEGSVRRSGEKIRITAQLVRASDSSHLWSQTYDRQLTDVFAVQDEIAATVVEQLKIRLLGSAPKTQATDPRAYGLVLQARDVSRGYSAETFEQAAALYKQALAIDDGYAAAWVGLANIYLLQANYTLRPPKEASRLARDAANKAITLDASYAPAQAVLGTIAMYDRDLAAAARHLEKAIAQAPANPGILDAAAILSRRLGRLEQAIALHRYYVFIDPMNADAHVSLGYSYYYADRLDEAVAEFRSALRVMPGLLYGHYGIAEVLLRKGEANAALAEIQQETDEPSRLIVSSMAYHALGRKTESDTALDELISKYETMAYYIAYVLAFRGEADRAFEWLDRAFPYGDHILGATPVYPMLENLHTDSRWLPFLRKIGMSPEQLAAINFDVQVPK